MPILLWIASFLLLDASEQINFKDQPEVQINISHDDSLMCFEDEFTDPDSPMCESGEIVRESIYKYHDHLRFGYSNSSSSIYQARFKDPNLTVTAMCGNGTGAYGSDIGYFISTEFRNK